MDINIYNIVKETSVLGPGNRYAIWLQGCKRRCKGCIAPDSRSFAGGNRMKINNIINEIGKLRNISGVTISGGEPLDQAKELLQLLKGIKGLSQELDIILYTGYQVGKLAGLEEDIYKEILLLTDLVIDGEYISELDYSEPLKGSLNQSYYYFSSKGERLIDEIEELEERSIEVEIENSEVFYIGLPNNRIKERLY